jgi:hypothetical protein
VFSEEGHDVILEPVGDRAGVGSVVDLERDRDAVAVQ